MNEIDLSYAAGIVDGEGTITIVKNLSAGRLYYNMRVAVTMTTLTVPVWLYNNFGGGLKSYQNKQPRHKRTYHWYLSGHSAPWFLGTILPYLKLKKQQAQVAIDFQKLKRNTPGVYRTPETIKEAQFVLRNKMMELNR